MARISGIEKAKNKQRLDEIILDIFIKDGFSAILYDRISEQSSMRISTIQGYYPSRENFIEALNGKLMPLFLSFLDLDNGRDAFINSWERALQERLFCHILRMLFQNVGKDKPSEQTIVAMQMFKQQLNDVLGEQYEVDLSQLLGRSVLFMLQE